MARQETVRVELISVGFRLRVAKRALQDHSAALEAESARFASGWGVAQARFKRGLVALKALEVTRLAP